MRVIAIDEALPHPTDSGKRIRTFELLSRAAREHEVVLVVPQERPPPPASIDAMRRASIEVVLVPRRPVRKHGIRFAFDLARNVFVRSPYMAMVHRVSGVADAVRRLAADRRPDVIHVEWMPLAVNVPDGLGVPTVVCAHNVESEIWARYQESERGWARRRYVSMQHRKVARLERDVLARADAVVAVSDRDARAIREMTGRTHVDVVRNGVDCERFSPVRGAAAGCKELLFLGSLDWRPNQDAVVWFLDEIWERVRREDPGASFHVVGRAPPRWLVDRASATPGVSLHADVPDVRPHLARAAVVVVPLRIGGGSRLKICEALAMERPVVSTTIGAEGLDVGDGAVLADGAEAFAAATARTLADPADAAARAARGRREVLSHHDWDAIAPRLVAAWSSAAQSTGTRTGTASPRPVAAGAVA